MDGHEWKSCRLIKFRRFRRFEDFFGRDSDEMKWELVNLHEIECFLGGVRSEVSIFSGTLWQVYNVYDSPGGPGEIEVREIVDRETPKFPFNTIPGSPTRGRRKR